MSLRREAIIRNAQTNAKAAPAAQPSTLSQAGRSLFISHKEPEPKKPAPEALATRRAAITADTLFVQRVKKPLQSAALLTIPETRKLSEARPTTPKKDEIVIEDFETEFGLKS